jgi:hypothetical protein
MGSLVDKKKLIILIFVVIGVLTIMMFGAGAYRSKNDRRPKDDAEPHPVAKLIGGATGWLKPEFKIERIQGCRDGSKLIVSTTCEVKIKPGGSRPSSFKLTPVSGIVSLCFAFGRDKLMECVMKQKEPKLREMKPGKEAGFTVAKDAAFLYISCAPIGNSPCQLNIKTD